MPADLTANRRALFIMKKKRPSRHDEVRFRFLDPGEDCELHGTVLIREGEMVLDIPGGCGPYLVKGKAREHWFEGMNSDPSGNPVEAKWARLGELYVGVWIESSDDGTDDYFFSFRLD